MIVSTSWRKLRLRCGQVASTRPTLTSSNRTVEITQLLYDIRPPVFQSKLHTHTEYELIVFLEVDGLFEDQMREQHLERGRVLLFSPQTKHIWHVSDASCQVFVVRFSLHPSFAIPMQEQWPVSPELADDAEQLSNLLLEANPGDLSYASSHLMMIVLRALSLFTPEKNPVKQAAPRLDLPEEIQKLVMHNPARQLTLEDIASHFGMSVRHLSRSFHSETQDTIIGHIIRCRLGIALSLLRESDSKISDVCARAGIPDQAYFCRCFRKYFGSTPSEYRNMARQSAPPAYQDENENG